MSTINIRFFSNKWKRYISKLDISFNPNFSFQNTLLIIHFIFVFFNIGILEFARKLKAKSDETKAHDTYSSRLGIKKSALIYVLICLVVYGLFIYTLSSLGFSQIVFAASLIPLNLIILSTSFYIISSNKTSSLLLQGFAALFYVSMHLLLVFTKI